MKKHIGLAMLGVVIVGFLFCQIWWQSVFKGNFILEIGTHIEALDSMKIEFYVDNKLMLDTTVYETNELLRPFDLLRNNHSAYFVVNGNKSHVFTFNNYTFTFVCVEYTESRYAEYIGFVNIRVQKHPLRFVM